MGIPEGQQWLIERIKCLGYDKIDTNGICHGVASAGMQAALSGDIERFYKRCAFISSIPLENFSNVMNQLQAERLAIIQREKQNAIERYKNLTKEEKKSFENDPLLEMQLRKIKDSIEQSERKSNNEKLEVYEKIKEELLQNRYAQTFIDQALDQLNEEMQIALEIPAFFEKIIIDDQSYLYPQLFSEQTKRVQDIQFSTRVSLSKNLEKENGVHASFSFSGIYDLKELETYFSSLEETIKSTNTNHPFVLMLSSSNHTISIYYNPQTNGWTLINANTLEDVNPQNTVKDLIHKKMAKLVLEAFSKNNCATFATTLCCTRNTKDEFNSLVNQWKENEDWKKTHEISFKKAISSDSFHASWLLVASAEGDLTSLENLLSAKYINVNAGSTNNTTPLYVAAENNRIEIVKRLLLKQKIDVNAAKTNSATPLFIASQNGNTAIVELLLDHENVDINASMENGYSPLHVAIDYGHTTIVRLLLQKKEININSMMAFKVTPLHIAIEKGRIDIIKLLLEHRDLDINAANENGATALHLAVLSGRTDLIQLLLQHKEININAFMKNGVTPLHLAVSSGRHDIVQLLRHHDGINVNAAMANGTTPLYIASQKGNVHIVDHLLKSSADVDSALIKINSSALFIAAQNGHIAVVKQLLHADADMSIEYHAPAKFLLEFAKKNHVETAMSQFIDKKMKEGQLQIIHIKPEEIAAIMGHTEIETLIHQVETEKSQFVYFRVLQQINMIIASNTLPPDQVLQLRQFKQMILENKHSNKNPFDIFIEWKNRYYNSLQEQNIIAKKESLFTPNQASTNPAFLLEKAIQPFVSKGLSESVSPKPLP